jgi:hypothetical protein
MFLSSLNPQLYQNPMKVGGDVDEDITYQATGTAEDDTDDSVTRRQNTTGAFDMAKIVRLIHESTRLLNDKLSLLTSRLTSRLEKFEAKEGDNSTPIDVGAFPGKSPYVFAAPTTGVSTTSMANTGANQGQSNPSHQEHGSLSLPDCQPAIASAIAANALLVAVAATAGTTISSVALQRPPLKVAIHEPLNPIWFGLPDPPSSQHRVGIGGDSAFVTAAVNTVVSDGTMGNGTMAMVYGGLLSAGPTAQPLRLIPDQSNPSHQEHGTAC